MSNILNWEGLNFVNTVSQVVIAAAAIIAIILTISQVRYRGKANIKGYYKCGLGAISNDSNEMKITPGVNVKIINFGLSPVYIERCGLMFVGRKKWTIIQE